MKKTIAIIMCLTVALAMVPMATGVAFADEPVTEDAIFTTTSYDVDADLLVAENEPENVGGWHYNDDTTVTADAQAVFDKAFENWTGAGYKAVGFLATQVVAGTNYLFRAEVTGVYPGAETKICDVVIYENLQGECSVTEVTEIPSNEASIDIAGGFTYKDGTISKVQQGYFDKAFENWTGVGYKAKKLMATQVVAGTNYAFLCEAKGIYPGAETTLKVVIINVDLEKNVSILDVQDYTAPAIKATSKIVKLKKGGKGIRVNWTDKEGKGLYYDEYIVYRAIGKNGKFAKAKTTTNKTFLNTNVKAGKTYYYKVKGVFKNVTGYNKTSAKIYRKMTK